VVQPRHRNRAAEWQLRLAILERDHSSSHGAPPVVPAVRSAALKRRLPSGVDAGQKPHRPVPGPGGGVSVHHSLFRAEQPTIASAPVGPGTPVPGPAHYLAGPSPMSWTD
jgi:hypothetical protein